MKRSSKPIALSVLLSSTALASTSTPVDSTYTDQSFSETINAITVGPDGAAGTQSELDGKPGTSGPDISLQFNQSSGGAGNELQTTGDGIYASATGGRGGDGSDYYNPAGSGAGGGSGGTITIGNSGKFVIEANGGSAHGIQATSQGGQGGTGADQSGGDGTYGGTGGAGADITIALDGSASLSTNGTGSYGILAQSLGAAAGNNGLTSDDAGASTQNNGSHGGFGGLVSISLDAGSSLTTSGSSSNGIVAVSRGNGGGTGGSIDAGLGDGKGGDGGAGGNSAGVTITSGGNITTHANSSMGIVAQSASGNGGYGGDATGATGSTGGTAGTPGSVGTVSVTNTGTISTKGTYSPGILAQSIAGGGGVGGSASGSLFYDAGGAATSASNAGTVNVNLAGTIATQGDNSQSVVAQSVGGQGGMGGDAGGMIVTRGGSGGAGGAGGAITITASPSTGSGFSTSTQGQSAHAIVAQSVGGGGGMGGAASSDGANVATAVGGTGGTGGSGSTVTINLQASSPDAGKPNISTTGPGAIGILAQSVGGGGGAGGGAYTVSAGALADVSVAVGGMGGDGGNGGTASTALKGVVVSTGSATAANSTLEADAIGVAVQSIGGGGGQGGSGAALAYAIAVPSGSEDPAAKVTFSGGFAVGGTGGKGGHGGTATATVDGGSAITTAGDGSLGLKIQSIGGGGGNGGDSSALAASIGYGVKNPYIKSINPSTNAINVSLAVGGSGGSGGDGGSATLAGLGDAAGSGGPRSTLTTRGAEATGVAVQSIGGGGGNAGVGNARVESFATSQNLDLKMSLGAAGGPGGEGGTASATVNGLGSIITQGAGAEGLVVQSIGGGGGIGSGSSTDLSGLDGWVNAVAALPDPGTDPDGNPISVGLTHNKTLKVGAQGGAGGDGGSASATLAAGAIIQTSGVDAPGVVVQSIGGGGGLGGSAAATAQAGGSTSATLAVAQDATPSISIPITVNSTVSIGGASGVMGDGGTVAVTHAGTISTAADHSPGIVAQSVGAGGGRGGVAAAGVEANGSLSNALQAVLSALDVNSTTTIGYTVDTYLTFNPTESLGDGHDVTVNLDGGTITTGQAAAGSAPSNPGFQSFGILAQSIGGGGGSATDGTAGANGSVTLGSGAGQPFNVSGAGYQTAFGYGGAVALDTPSSAAPTHITTQGDAAHGILLQSIGGGGGVYGAGSSQMAAGGGDGRTIAIALGAGPGAAPSPFSTSILGGDGGTVKVNFGAGSPVVLQTQGQGAFGLLAQSIGGGGGTAAVAPGVNTTVSYLGSESVQIPGPMQGSAAGLAGNGAAVSINIPAPTSSITTSGVGAHAIVAQSIGGGGGLISNYRAGETPTLTGSLTTTANSNNGFGDGGTVDITAAGTITTTGAGAYGVLAQSVGGGGGLVANNGSVFAGHTGTNPGSTAGAITISLPETTILAEGANSTGVWAQSTAPGGGGMITVNVGSATAGTTIKGGSGSSTGTAYGDGAGIVVSGGERVSQINISANSSVQAKSGLAIQAIGTSANVSNQGTIVGTTLLSGGSISGNSASSATTAPTATLTNAGTLLAPAGSRSVVDANLVQTATGRIVPHLDYVSGQSGQYVVTGSAMLDGTVEPTLASALPNTYLPVLTTQGTTSGSLRAPDSPLFSYTLRQDGTRHDLAITGTHFDAQPLGLTAHQGGVARTLETVFNSGNTELGPFFASLDATARADAGNYRAAIRELSPRSTMTLLSQTAANASRIADASMSCPTFASPSQSGGAILVEGECAYVVTRGGTTSLSGDDDRSKSRLNSFALQGGGQREILPGTLLGGSLAYQRDHFKGHSDGVTANGSTVQGAITVKQDRGPWQFTGAVFGNYGEYDIKRSIVVPGVATTAKANSVPMSSIGVRARVAYTAGSEQRYVRPSVNLDLVHARSGAYSEHGAGALGLNVESSSYNTAVLTPEVEVGQRHDLSGGGVVRSFVRAGVSVRSNDEWKGRAAFQGGQRSPSFEMGAPIDRAAVRLSAGVQVFANERTDVQLRYDAELGSKARSHNATARFTYRF